MNQSTAERIAILRSVSIFIETPDDSLADAAGLLEEVEFKTNQTIFEKGDPGDCMYIIVDGKVKVHDGEMIVNTLGKWDVFGEMAALDPEPRSATVTALEDTSLFRLGQANLYELINRRTGVAIGIIQILSQRLRARMSEMVEDFEYMQQFARVTSAAVAVEAGVYVPESLNEVAARSDELGQLARVFQRMVREVDTREKRLKQQVADLRIEIDEVKKARQVADITETEYFKELRQKAHHLRAERTNKEE